MKERIMNILIEVKTHKVIARDLQLTIERGREGLGVFLENVTREFFGEEVEEIVVIFSYFYNNNSYDKGPHLFIKGVVCSTEVSKEKVLIWGQKIMETVEQFTSENDYYWSSPLIIFIFSSDCSYVFEK